MASGGETCTLSEDERGIPLDIDDVHMLLQVEQEQIQKRTFTNWINAQLSKRSPPTSVQDLFSDLRDGTRLLDLLEVMSGQRMKRERGHGVFQQRGNIETALNFLKNKSIKLVNINIPDIIEGKPSIILGLIWTIILHCHIEELASMLSYGSRSSSLDSLSSLDSAPGSPASSPVLRRASPLHARFRLSAKKALLLWVRDQCQKVGCTASVRDFKSSWRSGEVFLAILCSLRPDLVDLSQAQTRSHLEKLEQAFHLAEMELGIPRLLEPEDIDVSNPDEKSIMTYIAQFLQYSNDLPSADDDFEASPNQKAREMTCWLQRAYQELVEAWTSTEGKGYAERYQVFQNFVGTYYGQRRPVIPLLSAMRRSAKPGEEQQALIKAWDIMEERLQEYRTELDVGLPAPLDTLCQWLQHMEAVLSEENRNTEDHALAARDARNKQEQLKVLVEDLSQHLNTLHHYHNTDDDGCPHVPIEKLKEIKRRFTSARVTVKYHGIKLQYRERIHHVYDLLGHLKSKLGLWRGLYGSQESVYSLLQDWHETVDKQGLLSMLKEALHKLKDTAANYTDKAALAEDSLIVNRQVKEVENETGVWTEAVDAARGTMERVLAAWESYKNCLYLLQVWLGQEGQLQTEGKEQKHLSEWSSQQAQLNEAGNFLIEMSDASTSHSLADELCRLNMQWADFIKRTKFAVVPQPTSVVAGVQTAQGLMQEAGWVLREAVEVSSGPLRIYRKKLQIIIQKISELNMDSLTPLPECKEETPQKRTLPEIFETLCGVDKSCEGLQRAASLLEGRVAELENWRSEAQDVCQHLKECQRRGHRGPHPKAKALISRGLQLEGQVVTESEDLQTLVTSVQKTPSLPYYSMSVLQDRVKQTVFQCQEVIEMLNCHGGKREGQPDGSQPSSKVIVPAYSQSEDHTQSFQQHQAPMFPKSTKPSRESLIEPQNQEDLSLQLQAQLGMQPQVFPEFHDKIPKHQKTAVCQIQQIELKQPVLSSVVGRKTQMKPQTEVQVISVDSSQTSGFGPSDSLNSSSLPTFSLNTLYTSFTVTPSGMPVEQNLGTSLKSQSQTSLATPHQRVLPKGQSFPQSHEPLQTQEPRKRQKTEEHIKTQSDPPVQKPILALSGSLPNDPSPPKPSSICTKQKKKGQSKSPTVPHVPEQNEVYARAQALAKSRLEKAKQHLQDHIQDVITVFNNKQPRKKQAASRLLRPAVLEEFIETVKGMGAFCTDAELGDLDLLCQSVRAQWEAGATATEHSGCLEALTRMIESLQHTESFPLAITHLMINTERVETVQHHKDSTGVLTPCQDRGGAVKDCILLRETRPLDDQSIYPDISQAIVQTNTVEMKQIPERTVIHPCSAEEVKVTPQEPQSRVKSFETAVELLESADFQIRLISDQLKQINQKPVNIRNFTVADAKTLHEDLKLLHESVEKLFLINQSESSVSDPADLSHNELQAHLPLQQTLYSHTKCLEELRHCLRKTESSFVALENLLSHLQQVNEDLTAAQSTSASTPDCSSRFASIWKSFQQAREESVRLDRILDDAGMRIALDDKPGSCHEMVSAMFLRAEEVETKLAAGSRRDERGGKRREKGEQKERMLGRKKMALQVTVKEVLAALERHGLKEPTLPALQHRLRFLTDMESKLVALHSEIRDLRDTHAQTNTSDTGLIELQTQWEDAHRAVTESHEQCVSLTELLKKFQSCRNRLGSTLQIAEQTLADQASYMGKDNLRLLISKVTSIKSELNDLGDGVEEYRAVCRQLQSLMRRIPDCADAPFESEADALMDRWLDVTEKTDCHLDNLQAGFSLWEKLLLMAGEVEGWTAQKLMTLAQTHPFQTEQDVSAMQDELMAQQENIEHFHRRSLEIQELLQIREFPLELQVIESQLRKRMAEVKELFSETSDVFTQLVAAKMQVSSEIAEHQSSIHTITDALNTLTSSESTQVLNTIQFLSEQLQTEAEQSEALLQQIGLLASIAGLENLHALAEDGARLQESICTARELIMEKTEQIMNPNNPKNPQMVQDPKHIKLWINKTQDHQPKDTRLAATLCPQTQSQSNGEKAEHSHRDEIQDALLADFRDFKQQAFTWASELHLKGNLKVSVDNNSQATLEERLEAIQVVKDLKPEADSRLQDLKVKGQRLLQGQGLEDRDKQEVSDILGSLEKKWEALLKSADEQHRFLQDVKELSSSCQCQMQQTESMLQELQVLAAELPMLFPWPGLAERRKAIEQTGDLLLKAQELGPALTAQRANYKELAKYNPSWTEPSWSNLECNASRLVQDLNDVCVSLSEGTDEEQRCALLMQQSQESLDSLQERIEDDCQDPNALKALLQAVEQEGRNLLEIEKLTDVLLKTCTSEGQTALSQDIQTLFGKTSALKRTLEEVGTWGGNSEPVKSFVEWNEFQQLGLSPEELYSVQVATDSAANDMDRTTVNIMSTEENIAMPNASRLSGSTQKAPTDVENLRPAQDTDKQKLMSGSVERDETGPAIRGDHRETTDGTGVKSSVTYGSFCDSALNPEAPKPILTLVLNSDISKPNQNPLAQGISDSATQWDTVSDVHYETAERSENGLEHLEAKQCVDVAVDEENSSDLLPPKRIATIILDSYLSSSDLQFDKNNHTDRVKPTQRAFALELDSRPKPEKDSSTPRLVSACSDPMVSHPENDASTGTANKVFTIILDVDSPTLQLDRYWPLQTTECGGPEGSAHRGEFSYSEVKDQQSSSSRTGNPGCQDSEISLLEMDNVRTRISESKNVNTESQEDMCEIPHVGLVQPGHRETTVMQPLKTSEVMEIDIIKGRKEESHQIVEDQHAVIIADLSSQMDVDTGKDSDLMSLVLKHDVTMVESLEAEVTSDKNTNAPDKELSNLEDDTQNPPNVIERRKKNNKAIGIEPTTNVSNYKLKTPISKHTNTTDSICPQTFETRLVDTTDTSLTVSSDTGMSLDTECKLPGAMNTLNEDTENLLQIETNDKHTETVGISHAGAAHTNTTGSPDAAIFIAVESLQSAHTDVSKSMPMDVSTFVRAECTQNTECKPLGAMGTIQKHSLNLLQTETENRHSVAGTISKSVTDLTPDDVVLTAEESVKSVHAETSESMSADASPVVIAECTTQNPITVPSETQFSNYAEAQRTEDLESSFLLQSEDMHRANSDRFVLYKTSQNRGSGADGEDKTRHVEQSRVWATFVDTVTNVQPLLVTSNVSEETRSREDAWCLNSLFTESEASLAWTVLRVCRCRNQQAQLSLTRMTHQLEEAEICRQCVLEHIARLPKHGASGGYSTEPEQRIEGRWNALLLDTSTMAQFKKSQLQQVTHYHQQKLALTDTLHTLEAELSTLTMDCIESSTLQAEKLSAFLKTMQKNRGMIEELLQTCCQISAHLSEAEGLVVCFEPVRNLQEKWQTLERAALRSLWHNNICTAEVSALLQESRELRCELELLEKSKGQTDCQNVLQQAVETADLIVLSERYLYLLELCQDLSLSPLRKKELKDMEETMQSLNSQLALVQEKLNSNTYNDNECSPIIKIIRDYFTWAKQTDSKVSRRRRLSLFTEEASHQINLMKKLQSEISLKRSQMVSVLKELKQEITVLGEGDSIAMSPTLKSLENLYIKITENTDYTVVEMNRMLHRREMLWKQIADSSSWLTSVLEKESVKPMASELATTIPELRVQLQICTEALKEAERQVNSLQTLIDETKNMNQGLSVPESFQLVDRLTVLQKEVSGVVNRKWASQWVLKELLNAQESSAKELNVIQKSLREMNTDIVRQKYPFTRDSFFAIEHRKQMLMEHLCKVQEIPHFPEPQRNDILHAILDLQRRIHQIGQQAKEQKVYLNLRQRMEDFREEVKKSLLQISDSSVGTDTRLSFCQALLVELPMVKMTCQEATDHLEAISKDLYPSQLTAEQQKISWTVEQLAFWELTVSNEAKALESTLVEDLRRSTDLSELSDLFSSIRQDLKETIHLEPENKALDAELRKHWTLIRTVESVLRMLASCRKGSEAESYKKTIDLGQITLNDCNKHMDQLLQAQKALKHYRWAIQGARSFFQQVESNLIVPSISFKDCKDEQRHIQQTSNCLAEGFKVHLAEVGACIPQHTCLSIPQTEQLHIQVLSDLLVQDAKLEAQAQLRLEALHRCMRDHRVHRSHHEEISLLLKNIDSQISKCLSQKLTNLEACQDQQLKVQVLKSELKNLAKRLEDLRESCLDQPCDAPADLMVGHLWRSLAVLQCRVESLKDSTAHKEAEWRDIMTRLNKSKEDLDSLQMDLPDSSLMTGSLEEIQGVLTKMEHIQDRTEQKHHTLASLQHYVARLLGVSNLQQLKESPQICQDLQSLQGHCRSLRDKSNNIRREALFEIQELGRVQEEMGAIQQSFLSLLTNLQSKSAAEHLQEVKVELVSQKARLQDVMNRVQKRWSRVPSEIQTLQDELNLSLLEAKEKMDMVMEKSGPLHKITEQVGDVTVGLNCVQALLKQRSPNFSEAERTQKRIWDELDQWHTHIAELEAEVQELAEEQPERAHILMDQLTEPLQLYQTTAKQAEHRTALISKIPACLQEYEGLLSSSTCWLREAQSWLVAPRTYTTAKCLHGHANSLKMMLDESEGYRAALEAFMPVLQEITPVCDTTSQEQLLQLAMQDITHMQQSVLDPLSHLQHLADEMDAIETEVKTMEKNLTKIRTILSMTDTENISPEEHLQNRQVILDNIQSMKRTIDEIESCRPGLGLPAGAEQTLTAFNWARELLQPIRELQQLSVEQSTALRASIGLQTEITLPFGQTMGVTSPHPYTGEMMQVSMEDPYSEEEDEGSQSSSSGTLTCSVPEDPDERIMEEEDVETKTASAVTECVTKELSPEDVENMDVAAINPGSGFTEPPLHEISDTKRRLVTEETTCLPAAIPKHSEEFTNESCLISETANEDNVLKAEEKTTKCPVTTVTEAVPMKPGTDLKNAILKTSDASETTEESEFVDENTVSITSETGTVDQVKSLIYKEDSTPQTPNSEAVEVTDDDQSQPVGSTADSGTKSIDTTTKSVPQQDTKLEMQCEVMEQRELIKFMACHSSSKDLEHFQSQEYTWSSSDTVSDPGQSVEECLAQLLTKLKKLPEELDSCQDINSSETKEHLLEIPLLVLKTRETQTSDSTKLMKDFASMKSLQGITWTTMHVWRRSFWQNNFEQQGCSDALLKGLKDLLELGSERIQRCQDTHPHNCSHLRSLLRGHKRFFRDLGQNVAMFKLLSHKLPEGALQGQAEVEQLISALQDQAQSHGVQMQHNLQEWSWYEEVTERLFKQLDELETDVPSLDLEPEGDMQGQLQSCEKLLKALEDMRPQVGEIQDQLRAPQNKGCCCEVPGKAVPRSRLLTCWQELHKQLEHKIHFTKKIMKNYDRFQHDSTELEEWMSSAHEKVQKLNSSSDRFVLTQLMEFFKELEVRSALKLSATCAGTNILHLTDSEAPGLRRRLAQLEQGWMDMTSMLPTLHQTQQRLLASQSQSQTLAELTSFLEHVESRMEEERSRVHCALGSTELFRYLQILKDIKAEVTSHQSCLDFLNQSVEGVGSVDNLANRTEHILFAEQLGALNLSWLVLQGKIDSEIHDAEDKWQAHADRERQLQYIHSWISQRMEWVRNSMRPDSCWQIEQALQECEEIEERLSVNSSELLGLRALHLFGQRDGQHPGDQGFSMNVNLAIQDCQNLSQQINTLKSTLRPIRDEWVYFKSEMCAKGLQTSGVVYRLELNRVPLFSSEQSRVYVEHLQELEKELDKSETWTYVTQVLSDLRDKLNPCAATPLSDHLEKGRTRHLAVIEDLRTDLLKAQDALRLWLEYERLTGECSALLNQHWERLEELLNSPATGENTAELLHSRMQSINVLEKDMETLQSSVGKVLEVAELLNGQIEPQSVPLIQSETRLLSCNLVHLGKALAESGAQVQEELEEHSSFNTELESLEQRFESFECIISSSVVSLGSLKMVLLDLSGLTPNLSALNQKCVRLVLSATDEKRLQTLNTQWVQLFSQVTDRHRKMYTESLHAQNFKQKCQCWMELLNKIEAGLSNQVLGNCSAIREQLALHQTLKVEVLISQQLLDAILNEVLRFLESGQIEDRSHLNLRLSQLKECWQEMQQRVQQHGRYLEGLMGKWQLYDADLKKLLKLLRHIEELLPPTGLAPCSLKQLQCSIKDFEWTEEQLQHCEELYNQTVEVGIQIHAVADVQTQTHLQTELDALKEMWEQSCSLVTKRKALANTITQTWRHCETGLVNSALKLKEIKTRLTSPLPEKLEELKTHKQLCKEDEDSLEIWAGGLKELITMKADVSQYVLPADTALLQGQVEELHSQWEELCLKVSLRKQEIADRLNAWIIFNDKNKELCDWLTQMEKKVAHRGENLSIEEMVEKLKKDCMEEINLFSENKSHLKQLGEQLLLASDKTKEAEIHGALRDVNDRWQHLFDHIEARVKKLTETLVTVQQLDKNMNNLRSWLSRIEAELAKPIHYSVCHRDEIQKKLAEQQDLQRDIEQHTERVASVLTLCEVLLHDEDACSSDGENESILQTTHSLDQRWRNICSVSLERRLRVEETWGLWCKFQEDYTLFENCLIVAEHTAAEPNSSEVLYTEAKEELKKYEAFQRQVHESLTQLEIINNQYRRLARENRTDAASRLRAMVHQGNQRWDALQRRVAAILRRLRHFTSQREEFEGTRESLLIWLTDIDLQLTNVEHFSESDLQDKMKQLKSFKKEITLNTNKIDALIVFGEGLIQKSSPQDAVVIEDELEELHTYCQEVFGRVARFYQRLTNLRPVLREQPELFDSEKSRETLGSPTTSQPSMCLLSPPHERSGRETPVSVDSIPLEWDHTGDVGGSSSHDEDEEAAFFSALSGQNWHFQNMPERKSLHLETSSPAHTSTPYKQDYVQLMSECSGSIKSVKRVSMILDDEEQLEEQGLTGLKTADKQTGVIERWELLQAQAVSKEQCSTRDPQLLTSDLNNITSWLDHVTPELDRLQKPETSVSLEFLEARVKQLKEMQKAFARYKTMMLSLNLGGRELQEEAGLGAQELKEDLRSMNRRWTEACEGLEEWEGSLRNTLEHCQEFHEMVHSLLLWLAHAESRRYVVNMHDPSVQLSMLQEHRNTLKVLAEELQERQKQVGSLQEIASELLLESGGEDSTEAREKLHVIGSKLRLLSCQVNQDLLTIQEQLEPTADATGDRKSSCSRPGKRDPSPQRSFFYRVIRAAFPLHLLFILLLVLACLVPLSEDDYSCTLSNNFARSFHPMLRYTNGPPPT
ncbi:nesprin-2-like [Myxocyprinus asiaticus]|uniref:nesprin-2-like n=1 Tax=Myxocyprinus asiaticus TaxID=70543 RepID=UPI0022235733|nr:nesprin-2-like [Myxocyprinus asiaticus]